MMNANSKILQRSLSLLAIVLLSMVPYIVFAQGEDPGGGPESPIDGGLSLLLAAGAAYGVKKYRNGKKKSLDSAQEVEKN